MSEKKLYSPKVIKEIIDEYGFAFSKSLGQNFLIDKNIIDKICDGAEIKESDQIIEIGPGIGTLTQELCKRARKVVAIEIDKNLYPILKDNLSSYDNFYLVEGDVLKIDLNALISDYFDDDGEIKVVANLPYYITTPIIMKLLEEKIRISKIVVMVQKEVALRMTAKPGSKDYGALSIAVRYYSNPRIIVNVPKNVFMPRPNVDSAVIMLDIYEKPIVEVKDEKLLFKIIKAAFSKRRKTLVNALSLGALGIAKEDIISILNECNIDVKTRAENLSLDEFAKITNTILSK
ncbi:16S rRNA (adenine(1518)-N(6)/adenine(1519)-N(6))-dimethyltransferase RsmA [Caloranaerobacter azorensis]|uniref:Ribosomal RNA small subunit methyltransferase A n=1 Tax=Caloranaerobacter azorensis TaxID=116090 RepID=A0A6P1YFT2_9FIRM|nr:16S rRNA (adenine(1518)-N(6)/adenine(1519)-N(6))-dimethyltransferase RsmA [Caloranaerobacter azorensis]QIB27782.1 16S rRNA (adenine(1518)-N(6)/adenine(1519)-N(6))-dimethyltransferase RsmA [Caloranaerobacter azorensis]